jgi:small multidrug resistance pump
MINYVFLFGTILLEVFGTTCLKYSDGFSKLLPSIVSMAAYIMSLFLFSKLLTRMNLGIAYATWAGLGIVLVAVVSAVLFHQHITTIGAVSICLIIAGCVTLNLYGQG